MLKRFAILFVFILSANWSLGQLTTNTNLSAAQLVQQILVGQGVTVSNITYTGDLEAIGQFNGLNSNLGIDQGVMLSTGTVLDKTDASGIKKGPVGPNNNGAAATLWNTPGDADLTNLIGDQTFDGAILEFDFIPQGDTVKFNYVFASEEYIEFVGSINDVFAFFISGPGIVGTQNIATVPGSNVPVSIANINHVTNSAYFINNGNGFNGPQSTDPTVINFDGYTVPLTAVAKVTPCVSYHLKIAIADVSDADYDSGVFLQGGSLNSSALYSYEIDTTFNPLGEDTLISEGCSNGVINFSRIGKIWNASNIGFRLLGTAVEGVDYTISHNSLNFAANEDEKTITITSLADNINEVNESVIMRLPNPFICDIDSVDIEFTIVEQTPLVSTQGYDTIRCVGLTLDLEAEVNGGVPGYSYLWGTGATTQSINVAPIASTSYPYTATDTCGNTVNGSIDVHIPVLQPLDAVISNDTTIRCPGVDVPLFVRGVNGGGVYSYVWNEGESTANITKSISNSVTYSVDVTDFCGNSITKSVSINLNYPQFSISASEDTTICYGDSAALSSTITGGIAPYTYVWETGDLSQTTSYSGLTSNFITITATDSCGILSTNDSVFVTVQKPTSSFSINAPIPDILEIIEFQNTSQGNTLTYEWDLGEGTVTTSENTETAYPLDSIYTISLIVEDDLGCRDTSEQSIQIFPPLYYYLPNTFTPNNDGLNEEFIGKGIGVIDFQLRIFDRWGIELFATDNPRIGWDGRFKSGKKVPDGVYVYRVKAVGGSGKTIEKIGHITLLR